MWRRAGLGAALVGGLIGLVPLAAAEDGRLYRWTDAEGVVRYTPDAGRVPLTARDTLEVIEAPEALAPEPASNGAPAAPGALPAVMGRKLSGDLIAPDPPAPADLEGRIAELREAIRRDQQELQELVASAGASDGGNAAAREERLTVLANRLPELQAELARLESLRLGAPEP